MQIKIIAIGKIRDRWIREGMDEYKKRLTPYCRLEVVEAAEERFQENPSALQIQQGLEKEGKSLLKAVPDSFLMIALDLHGTSWSSEKLADQFHRWGIEGKSQIAFVIGGTYGISDEVRGRSAFQLQLSPMTFTHTMTRLILLEQIYRSFKIMRGEKYHW